MKNKSPFLEAQRRLTERPTQQRMVMRQDWLRLLFLHWRVPAEAIQKLLPPGLSVDTFEGEAYIGLVPFTMRNVRPLWSPSVQGLSHFHETNVRTYVHVNGEPGVWFFSLDAANPIAVALARALFHLPYYYAFMTLATNEVTGETETYSRRYYGGMRAVSNTRYTPVDGVRVAEPGTLDYFLCERYLLYSYQNGRLYSGRVHHTPYPIQNATLHDLSNSLVSVAGFPGATEGPPIHIAYAQGVNVEVFALEPLAR